MGIRAAFLGNFSVPYSSESHEAASFEALGHEVLRLQEGEVPACDVAAHVEAFEADLFFHVQTRGLAITGGTDEERAIMLSSIYALGIPSAGYHLDLFFGLDRAEYVRTDPYFKMDFFFSTDGAHDDEWAAAGVNHHWLPPAVYHAEAYDGTPRDEYQSDIAFVGSWKAYAHQEHWQVRKKMLDVMRRKYGRRFKCWPQGAAVRGTDLTDLYASVKITIGDSCLAGQVKNYWSDRVPEAIGRGGFLIHPYVLGILNIHPDLVTFTPSNWDEMVDRVDFYLNNDSAREHLRKSNATWARTRHTYKNRIQTILDTMGIA